MTASFGWTFIDRSTVELFPVPDADVTAVFEIAPSIVQTPIAHLAIERFQLTTTFAVVPVGTTA